MNSDSGTYAEPAVNRIRIRNKTTTVTNYMFLI